MRKITLLIVAFILTMVTYAQDNLVYEQEDNNPGVDGVISDYFNSASGGTYSADDFELTGETTLDSLKVYGFSASDAFVENLLVNFHFYIYADADGEPAGNPSDEGSGELEIILSVDDPALNVTKIQSEDRAATNYAFAVDIPQAMGEEHVSLPAGTYWIVPVAELSDEVSADDPNAPQWNWLTSTDTFGSLPKLTDPQNLNGVGPGWTEVNQATGSQDFNAFAFSIYGDESMSVENFDQSNFKHYTKNNTLYLSDESQIGEVAVYNMLGQKVAAETLGAASGELDISDLGSGVYVAKVAVKGQSKSFKFVKK